MSKIFLTNKDRKLSLLESNVIFAAENDEIEFDLSDFSFKLICQERNLIQVLKLLME